MGTRGKSGEKTYDRIACAVIIPGDARSGLWCGSLSHLIWCRGCGHEGNEGEKADNWELHGD
jgi:hypothetical protein